MREAATISMLVYAIIVDAISRLRHKMRHDVILPLLLMRRGSARPPARRRADAAMQDADDARRCAKIPRRYARARARFYRAACARCNIISRMMSDAQHARRRSVRVCVR